MPINDSQVVNVANVSTQGKQPPNSKSLATVSHYRKQDTILGNGERQQEVDHLAIWAAPITYWIFCSVLLGISCTLDHSTIGAAPITYWISCSVFLGISCALDHSTIGAAPPPPPHYITGYSALYSWVSAVP